MKSRLISPPDATDEPRTYVIVLDSVVLGCLARSTVRQQHDMLGARGISAPLLAHVDREIAAEGELASVHARIDRASAGAHGST